FDPVVVTAAMCGCTHLFHVAAAYRVAGLSDDIYRAVHVTSTQLLANAAAATPGFQRFVHVSTVGVHGHIEQPPANEEQAFHPGDIYQRTKAEAELWLRDFAPRHGLPFTVIRPAAIYGPGDRRLLKLFKMATWPIFPILGHGRGLYHLIHVDDLAEVLIMTAVDRAAAGEVFIAGNTEHTTLTFMARTIAAALGRKIRIVHIPAGPVFIAADLCEALCRPFGWRPPLHRRRVAFYTKDRAFDTTKLHTLPGCQMRYSNEQGLRQTALWYRNHGWI
ncbi:MAG: NAD-dependent epimerase/dehydratase family protein, partial [bacterium]